MFVMRLYMYKLKIQNHLLQFYSFQHNMLLLQKVKHLSFLHLVFFPRMYLQ